MKMRNHVSRNCFLRIGRNIQIEYSPQQGYSILKIDKFDLKLELVAFCRCYNNQHGYVGFYDLPLEGPVLVNTTSLPGAHMRVYLYVSSWCCDHSVVHLVGFLSTTFCLTLWLSPLLVVDFPFPERIQTSTLYAHVL